MSGVLKRSTVHKRASVPVVFGRYKRRLFYPRQIVDIFVCQTSAIIKMQDKSLIVNYAEHVCSVGCIKFEGFCFVEICDGHMFSPSFNFIHTTI